MAPTEGRVAKPERRWRRGTPKITVSHKTLDSFDSSQWFDTVWWQNGHLARCKLPNYDHFWKTQSCHN